MPRGATFVRCSTAFLGTKPGAITGATDPSYCGRAGSDDGSGGEACGTNDRLAATGGSLNIYPRDRGSFIAFANSIAYLLAGFNPFI
jgi:hypothetical protein